jgi:hypothetical protein
MTRMFSRASRITQPISIPRLRDPSIHTLGFQCFRLLRKPRSTRFEVVAFLDRKNAMSAFLRA